MWRSLLACALLLVAACASPPRPMLQPSAGLPPLGINDAYHGPILNPWYCPAAMLRSPQLSGEALDTLRATVTCPMLALVEGPDLTQTYDLAMHRPAAIELGNELELEPYELTPAQYADWIDHALARLAAAKYVGETVLGGVYALTPDTQAAITLALRVCDRAQWNCVVGVHLYDASDDDLAWLRRLKRRVWVTEFGFPTRCDPARLQQQHDWIDAQWARFATVPTIERVFVYQRPVGPTCSDLDTFGIAGQPAESLFR